MRRAMNTIGNAFRTTFRRRSVPLHVHNPLVTHPAKNQKGLKNYLEEVWLLSDLNPYFTRTIGTIKKLSLKQTVNYIVAILHIIVI